MWKGICECRIPQGGERDPVVGALHTEGEGASVERFSPHKRSIACKLPVHDQYIS